jgi:putative phosphoribosyl transferase
MTKEQLEKHHVIISNLLEGDLAIPLGAQAIVLFAHGSGSSRHSLRNHFVANILNNKGIATLLVDLFTQEEKRIDEETRHLRYNIELLAGRFTAITNWLAQHAETRALKIGYFGSSTGAAAALIVAARLGAAKAIVTRGGRPDLVGENFLHQVKAPTLFIVGGEDKLVIAMNKVALASLKNAEAKELAIIPNATHLFEQPEKMEEVAQIAADWFECYLLEKRTKKNFHTKYSKTTQAGFLSSFWNRHAFQIRFRDRVVAGELLASLLGRYKNDRNGVLVIGIARGGIVVADVVAEKLGADFDIIVPRKLRSPQNSENAIGAIMHDNAVYLDTSNLEREKDISNEYINMEISEQRKEMERRLRLYRPSGREYKIKDRTVILVDDGIATGATMISAARWVRAQLPKQVIIAAPVASKQACERLKKEAEQIEVIRNPSDFIAVEQFYQHFAAVSDSQIEEIAKKQFLF